MQLFCRTSGGSYFAGFRLSIFHGSEDKVVPSWMGARLFETAKANRAFHVPESMDQTQTSTEECYHKKREEFHAECKWFTHTSNFWGCRNPQIVF